MVFLTFDQDWCTDEELQYTVDLLNQHNVVGTFFMTGPTEVDLTGHEIGIHPNFMPDSTQGKTEDEVLSYLKRLYPDAIGMRTHRFYWHSGLYERVVRHGIRYDTSILLPGQCGLNMSELCGLYRIPTWWEDDIESYYYGTRPDRITPILTQDGIKILLFHPVHIRNDTFVHERFTWALACINAFMPTLSLREYILPWPLERSSAC